MFDEFKTFVETPTADHYRAAREALLGDESHFASPEEIARVEQLSGRRRHAAVLAAVDEMMPRWALSPRVHFYAASAAEAQRQRADAELSYFVMEACLEGILATGRGTAASPYLVTYSADIRDVLDLFGLKSKQQALTPRRSRFCDVVTCTDGARVWFDVTETLLATDGAARYSAIGQPK